MHGHQRNLKLWLVLFKASLVLALISPQVSLAQSTGGTGHAAGLYFGQVWPAGDIGTNANAATAPGVFYEYAASEVFSLLANFTRSSHDSRLSIFSGTADLKANLVYYDKLVPYAFIGVGLYSVKKELPNSVEEISVTHFGINFGLGSDLDLSDTWFVGLSLALHILFSANTDSIAGPTETSGRWSSLFLRVGMRF